MAGSTPPSVRLRRNRSISQAPNVSSLETSETSIEMPERLPFNFSASATMRSNHGANGDSHSPAARSARPLPCATRSKVGSPLTRSAPASNPRRSCQTRFPPRRHLVETVPKQPYSLIGPSLRLRNLPDLKMSSSLTIKLAVRIERWPIAGSFTISRGAKTEAVTVVAEVSSSGHVGRGECVPYPRYGETPEAALSTLKPMRELLKRGLDRQALQAAMPAGAARNALDCALVDLEAKISGRRAWDLLGRPTPQPCTTAYTISLGTLE